MGKFDKDRHQKELALRYCLARGMLPFLEVVVPSASDLSDASEVLTDLDVLGLESSGDGSLRRVLFDCKTTNKMSSINRAFWAAGVMAYTGCSDAHIILKNRAVHNHRISALALGVDLHDERAFKDFAQTADPGFPQDLAYQSSIERWNGLYDIFDRSGWSRGLYEIGHNITPLTREPWDVFRKTIAELRAVKGHVDPEKPAHVTIFLDLVSCALVLWSPMSRDLRRFYDPSMRKSDFEQTLRYYVWGGRESYSIRQQLRRDRTGGDEANTNVELPAWDALLSFAGIVVGAPQAVLEAAYITREAAIRGATAPNHDFDARITQRLKLNTRARQFALGLSAYLVAAGGLPSDMQKKVQAALAQF